MLKESELILKKKIRMIYPLQPSEKNLCAHNDNLHQHIKRT